LVVVPPGSRPATPQNGAGGDDDDDDDDDGMGLGLGRKEDGPHQSASASSLSPASWLEVLIADVTMTTDAAGMLLCLTVGSIASAEIDSAGKLFSGWSLADAQAESSRAALLHSGKALESSKESPPPGPPPVETILDAVTFHDASEISSNDEAACVILARIKGASSAMPWLRSLYVPQPAEPHTPITFLAPAGLRREEIS
jgi:hypothetical protein